jgi:hypothetical protein
MLEYFDRNGDPYSYRREVEEGNTTSNFYKMAKNKCTDMRIMEKKDDFMSAGVRQTSLRAS